MGAPELELPIPSFKVSFLTFFQLYFLMKHREERQQLATIAFFFGFFWKAERNCSYRPFLFVFVLLQQEEEEGDSSFVVVTFFFFLLQQNKTKRRVVIPFCLPKKTRRGQQLPSPSFCFCFVTPRRRRGQ